MGQGELGSQRLAGPVAPIAPETVFRQALTRLIFLLEYTFAHSVSRGR
jgi:hypothetical protein